MSYIAEWSCATRRYKDVIAVQDVSLGLRAGEVTALIGHNGAGKTTLIKLLLGLIRPDVGSVRVSNVDPAGHRGAEARRAVGFLPENVAFHRAMTGTEVMSFYAGLKGHSSRRNAKLLEIVGIADAAHRRVVTYSKGMRQRLGIAQALIGEPKLLLFDEPTSGLDPASRVEVFNMIDTLRVSGATVLVSTHALAEVENRVDRVAVMNRGRLLAAGTLAELRKSVEADVRLRLRVRPCTTHDVIDRLPADARCVDRTADALELRVSPLSKMAVLRAVAELGDIVEDIEITTSGLEELYQRLIESQAATA